ncbi:MAG: pyridoxal phosphate-dependent aminotransferase [Gammaproteobacteria bacterium]|mgnify:FL=1|nr:pyridoxal phosphate-dependent aminotransferase [Gammaproteobacteria bacterium]MBT6755302.1 pyridoxal phosphate-dependent aminotransferase [Gammaproteobacteria bacterium]MDA9896405.1 pyridoxal phosphate-dependent aminotransferase [Gammaproteobacteria bacterium]MDC3386703.1 pyridoxal phosphate-dependent aminotransferase [Gammaproteobacteria bacterium]
MKLSKRISNTKTSATIAMSMKARELTLQGKDIISLSAGEPDFDTPRNIKNAAIESINSGNTKYTPVDGMLTLKESIVKKFKNENNLEYTPDQIIVSTGCKQSIYNLCQATLDEGDEVLIPSPYWVSYPEIVKLSDAVPVFVETNSETDFKVTGKMLEDNITKRTKMILLNSPSNPSGFIYSQEDLKDIGRVLKKYPNIIIASDDIYEHIIFNGKKFTNILNVCPELYDQTIVLNGVSKAYAMTGWRIGYAAGNSTIIGAMKKIQSQSTSCTCSISQAAAKAALDDDNSEVTKMVSEYQLRSEYLHTELNKIEGIKYKKPEGSFYAFVDVNGLINKIENINDDFELAEYFLREADVAVVPGTAFGSKNHIRISFATSLVNLEKAVCRIKNLLS